MKQEVNSRCLHLYKFYGTELWFILPQDANDHPEDVNSAFTVAELIRMTDSRCLSGVNYSEYKKDYYYLRRNDKLKRSKHYAHACGDVLLEALERGWTSVEEVNKQLMKP